MIRQGDVMVVAVAALPKKRDAVPPENGRVVLAHGEATGHHHSFAFSDRVALFREDGAGGGLFLTVTGDAPVMLEHQEHTALAVPPGTYRVIRQRVWNAGMARRVED
jgi:hypothetical protein